MLLCILLILFGIHDFSFRHGVIFETIGSLLSLLRSGARDAYRQFFVDSMLVVEGIKKFFLNFFFCNLYKDGSRTAPFTCFMGLNCFCGMCLPY
jgi:hypothetical protein